MVFLLIYFSFSTLIATILLKEPLIKVKNQTEDMQEAENKDTL